MELLREHEGLIPPLAMQILEWLVRDERSQDLRVRECLDRNRCSQVASNQSPQGPQQH